MRKKIFVTGGAGYIGSHVITTLLRNDYEVMVFDNFSNSSEQALRRVELLSNRKIKWILGDICDESALADAMRSFQPTSVIHCAGLKSVSESSESPGLYYAVNVGGSTNLLNVMSQLECSELVFSSSATVYSNDALPPFSEDDPLSPISPYGRSKLMVETIISKGQEELPLIKNDSIRSRYYSAMPAVLKDRIFNKHG